MTTQDYAIRFAGSVFPNTFVEQTFDRIGTLRLTSPSALQGATTNFSNAFEIAIFSPSPGVGRLRFTTNNALVSGSNPLDTAFTLFDPFTNIYTAIPDSTYGNVSANFIGDGINTYSVFGGSVDLQPQSDGTIQGLIRLNLDADEQIEYVASLVGNPLVGNNGGVVNVGTGGTARGNADPGVPTNPSSTDASPPTPDANPPTSDASQGAAPILGNPSDVAIAPSSTGVSLRGTRRKDVLAGTANNDTLIGLKRNDRLSGNAGDDNLIGGKGKDRLTGGSGADQFVFIKPNEGMDRIPDFSDEEKDVILVSARRFKGRGRLRVDKPIKKRQFEVGKGADDRSDRFIYNRRSGVLFFDPDGDRKRGSVRLAKLPSGLDLNHRDIATFRQLSSIVDA